MTAAPTNNKTMTTKERLQLIEKEMQNVMLSHFESHFSRNQDAEDALASANHEANQWFKAQVAMHGRELQDHVNARKFDKVKFLERFAKVDAAMEDMQTQMISRLSTDRGMSVTKARTLADREGKKYHDGKELLATRLALDENAKKAVGKAATNKPKATAAAGHNNNKGETTTTQQPHKARPAART